MEPLITTHYVPSPCQSGSCRPSKRQLPAVEAPVAHRHSYRRSPSRNRPLPVFAAAFARHCPPSQLLSPAVTVAVASAAFTCRCLPSQLPSPIVAAAIASCCLSLSSAPPDRRAVDRPLTLHHPLPMAPSSPLTTNIVTISSSPPPTPVARRAVHRPLLLLPSSMLLPSRVPALPLSS
jgi:hypothetical protein